MTENGYDAARWEQLDGVELAKRLKAFYCTMRMENGQKYSRSAYSSIRDSLQRHIKLPPHNSIMDIKKNAEFTQANLMWSSMTRELRMTGNDVATHKVPVSRADLRKLAENINMETPAGLQHAFFIRFLCKFARRGREGLSYLKKCDLIFDFCDREQRNFVAVRVNEITKKDQAGESSRNVNEQERNKKMWETPGTKNSSYEIARKYVESLNPECDYLFQKPNPHYCPPRNIKMFTSKLGVNKIDGMMKDISHQYGLSIAYTNH